MAESKKGFNLAAALGEVSKLDTGAEGREQIEYIALLHIHPDERNFYDLKGIDKLAASIEFAGLQQPIRVRKGETEGEYVIVSGHRRHAALTKLAEDGQERFQSVACIVEQTSGRSTEVEELLQELRLIYGNSDTRRMSSADISKQAERVETLLYQLKEAGVEFPGRMRDHVAEACKVSATKLARLKMIRENLDEVWKPGYSTGKLSESVAYELAQIDAEKQKKIYTLREQSNRPPEKYLYAQDVECYAGRFAEVDKLECPSGGKCIAGGKRMKALELSRWIHYPCGKCCGDCFDLGRCKRSCLKLADKVKDLKQAEKERKRREKAEAEERARPKVEQIEKLWHRFGEAQAAAGLRVTVREKFTENDLLPYGDYFPLSSAQALIEAADALGVSLDYLLCRTDEPGGRMAAEGGGE